MVESTPTFDALPSVQALKTHYESVTSKIPLRDLLNDEQRNEKLRSSFGSSVHFDYSHTHIDSEGIDLLNKVATEAQVGNKI